nr:hypothetical protein [Angustibacter aerolatus]
MVRITPRGPLSAALLHALDGGDATTLRDLALEASDRRPLIDDDDVRLSLYLMYEPAPRRAAGRRRRLRVAP